MPAEPRPATTVLLLRDAADGLEVFLVQRHGNSGFLPNAWVFPGGRVDQHDALDRHPRVQGGDATAALLGMPRPLAVSHLVAGVRETFEESGIWLGSGAPPAHLRDPLNAGTVHLGDLLDQHGATLDLDRLAPWAHWVTPVVEPRRFDTWFFVAHTADAAGSHDDHETVDSGWFRPVDVLTDPSRFPLAPPTWWTLRELTVFPAVAAILAASPTRSQTPIQPVIEVGDAGMELLMPGHSRHPFPRIPGLPTNVRFEHGRWVGFIDGDRMPPLPA